MSRQNRAMNKEEEAPRLKAYVLSWRDQELKLFFEEQGYPAVRYIKLRGEFYSTKLETMTIRGALVTSDKTRSGVYHLSRGNSESGKGLCIVSGFGDAYAIRLACWDSIVVGILKMEQPDEALRCFAYSGYDLLLPESHQKQNEPK